MTINEARGANQIKASHTTMWRVCHESKSTQFLKIKNRPALKQSHIDKRLQWAKNKMSWTTEWNNIIFTDEKKFNLDGPDGYKYYWHDLRCEPEWFSKRVLGGGSLMVWGAIGSVGKFKIVFIDKTMNAKSYKDLLDKYFLPFSERIGGNNWTLQQDNSPVYRSGLIKQ